MKGGTTQPTQSEDFLHEADLRGNWSCQGFPFYPMASVGAEELRSTHRGFRRTGGSKVQQRKSGRSGDQTG